MTVMSNEDPALPEVSAEEAWYDAEIAPALAALAKRCHGRDMAFLALVEYQPGDRGSTCYMTENAGLEMHMLRMASMTVPNVDRYILTLRKHCKDHGQDINGSFVLRGLDA